MKCGRCETLVTLKLSKVSCPSCKLSHDLEFARAQVIAQAGQHGHIVDQHSFRADTQGLLVFNIQHKKTRNTLTTTRMITG